MQPNKTLFFSIIGIAVIICIGLIAARFLLTDSLNLPSAPEDVAIEVVVADSIEPWAKQAAQDFNQANPASQVNIITVDSLIPPTNNQPTPPVTAWLPATSFALNLASKQGFTFDEGQSMANSVMAWGGYNNKLDDLNLSGANLTWDNIHTIAASDDGLKIVLSDPQDTVEGLAALIAATAGHAGSTTLTANDISNANSWLSETFGNRNAQLPATPAGDFATKGVSAGDMGILSMAAWQKARLDQKADFTLTPTQPAITLDYPFVINSQSSPEAQAAAVAFRQFLLESNQQNKLSEIWLNPASTNQNGVQIDETGLQRLIDWANRELR